MKTVIAHVCLSLVLLYATPALAILTGNAPPLPKPETTLTRTPGQGGNAATDSPHPATGNASASPATANATSSSASAAALASTRASTTVTASTSTSTSASAPPLATPSASAFATTATSPAMAAPAAAPTTPVSNLLQVISALIVVLLLMFGCSWLLKNHGSHRLLARVPTRIIGGVNLGGRERILVVEVGDQWLVVGSTPTQINLLTTLPRQENLEDEPIPGKQFSVWLKQVMEKRNG